MALAPLGVVHSYVILCSTIVAIVVVPTPVDREEPEEPALRGSGGSAIIATQCYYSARAGADWNPSKHTLSSLTWRCATLQVQGLYGALYLLCYVCFPEMFLFIN